MSLTNLLFTSSLASSWVRCVANPIHAIFLFTLTILSVYGNLVANDLSYLTVCRPTLEKQIHLVPHVVVPIRLIHPKHHLELMKLRL